MSHPRIPKPSPEFLWALGTTTPVLLGYLAIGLAFGLMMDGAGYPWFLALAMSLFMYAGAGQYLAVDLFRKGATLGEMAILTLMVNARHMVYGLSLKDLFGRHPRIRPYLVFSLTDETYALMTSLKVPKELDEGACLGLVAAMDQAWWVAGTLLGSLAGALLPIPTKGLEFSLTALFAVLVTERWLQGADRRVFAIAAACAGLSLLVFGPANMLLPSILAGMAVLLILPPGTPKTTPVTDPAAPNPPEGDA